MTLWSKYPGVSAHLVFKHVNYVLGEPVLSCLRCPFPFEFNIAQRHLLTIFVQFCDGDLVVSKVCFGLKGPKLFLQTFIRTIW